MTPEQITAWLQERRDNCERIAETKVGADRAGWLEDARYFQAAIDAIRRTPSADAATARRRAIEEAAKVNEETAAGCDYDAGSGALMPGQVREMRRAAVILNDAAAAIRALAEKGE